MAKISESSIFLVLLLGLLFFLLMFDQDMALIFLLMLVADYVFYKEDNRISLPTEKGTGDGRFMSLGFAVMIYAGFLLFTSFLVGTLSAVGLQSTSTGMGSVISLLATTTPVLAGSKILTLIGWGIIIPIIETRFFFGRLLEVVTTFIGKITKRSVPTKFEPLNIWLHLSVILVAGVFALFHLTAKGLDNNIGLLIVFIFGIISCWTVLVFNQLREAITFHILSNSVSVLAQIGPGILKLFGIVIGDSN